MVDVLSALLTPMIAVVAVWIAYQQLKTNKTRLNLEQYDRRLAIYKALDAFYAEVGVHGTAKYPMVFKMRADTAEAAFLFPPYIEKHMTQVFEKAMRLASLHELMYPSGGEPGLPVGEERQKAAEEEGQIVLWLLQEAKPESKRRFGKYLRLA
jgi:hypothetical protein